MRNMRVFMSDLWYRSQVLGYSSYDGSLSIIKGSWLAASGLFGIIRWFLWPDSYSIAHMDAEERVKASQKFGPRWSPDPKGRMVCSMCTTGKPMDFLDFALGYDRWDPAEAHAEVLQLIERGDMDDTAVNHNRWADIPSDGMVVWSASTNTVESALPMIVAYAHDGDYYSMSLSHLADLRTWEFELIQSWMEVVIPEWVISRSGTHLSCDYTASEDIMAGVNPYAFTTQKVAGSKTVVIIAATEEDEDD